MSTPSNFKELVGIFVDLIRTALPVIAGLALLVFIWGLVKFVFRVGGDEKVVEEGKKLMIWGLIALFMLVSFMAILAFVYGDIGFSQPFGLPFLPL
ncbi:MAG: hypothetical protein Q8Q22_00460 [bacterium]|nr:hypothetical protein [bacterium]